MTIAPELQRHTQYVDATDFVDLMTSRRTLVRDDDVERGLRGLFDPNSGVIYYVEEGELRKFSVENDAKLMPL